MSSRSGTSGKWPKQEIFRERIVEIVRDVGKDLGDAVLLFEFLDGLRIQPAFFPVRRQVEHRLAVAVTVTVSPSSTRRASSVRRFFASFIETVMPEGAIFAPCFMARI